MASESTERSRTGVGEGSPTPRLNVSGGESWDPEPRGESWLPSWLGEKPSLLSSSNDELSVTAFGKSEKAQASYHYASSLCKLIMCYIEQLVNHSAVFAELKAIPVTILEIVTQSANS